MGHPLSVSALAFLPAGLEFRNRAMHGLVANVMRW